MLFIAVGLTTLTGSVSNPNGVRGVARLRRVHVAMIFVRR